MLSKILDIIKSRQYPIFLGICIVLIALISFNLGKINASKRTSLKINSADITNDADSNLQANVYKATSKPLASPSKSSTIVTPKPTMRPPQVVVSKNSTSKKYHFSWCPGAKQIKPENQVWFNTETEAIAAGYTLAGNCTK